MTGTKRRSLVDAALLLAALSLVIGCGPLDGRDDDDDDATDYDPSGLPQGPDPPREPTWATIEQVYDGDTAQVQLESGFREIVRFLNIDTPETDDGTGSPECWAYQATARTRELLPEEQVIWLTWDGEEADGFDRWLAHIFVGDAPTAEDWVNLSLVREGHARAFIFAANATFEDEFLEAEDEARSDGRGLWGECH